MATPHDAPPKALFMLTVYIDESEQESPEHVVLAGFVGTCEQWSAFSSEWRKGLGAKSGLHMRDLYWIKPRTEHLLARLGPIPHQYGLKPVVGAVRVSDYIDLISNPVEGLLAGGYICALYPVIRQVMLAFPGDERIKWVFEEQERYEPLVRQVFNNYDFFDFKPRLAGVEFAPKDSTILTQPADYLAYAQLQHLRDPKSKKSRWCASILQNLPASEESIVSRERIRQVLRFALYWATIQTVAETGKPIDQVIAGHGSRSQMLDKIREIQSRPSSPVTLNEPGSSLHHWALRTWFLKRYAIARILGRSQEQALLELQSGLPRSERIRLAAVVDESFAQTKLRSNHES
jgi:hypothetical protein